MCAKPQNLQSGSQSLGRDSNLRPSDYKFAISVEMGWTISMRNEDKLICDIALMRLVNVIETCYESQGQIQ